MHTITTQRELRKEFWRQHPSFEHQVREAGILTRRQNEHCATVRCAFVDFIDHLTREGTISEALASRATL